jgi:hypothetical protein
VFEKRPKASVSPGGAVAGRPWVTRLAVRGRAFEALEGRQHLAVGDERSEEPTESIKKTNES